MDDTKTDYTIIVPVYNEEDSILTLYGKLKKVLIDHGSHEIIFVDDGSTDQTFQNILECAERDKRVKIIKFRRNFGQSAALKSGFDYAAGETVITIDADLQNNPEDIPKLLKKFEEGYDVVCGWRKHRKDPFFRKKVPSKIFNWFCRRVSGQHLHDFGSTLRVYRREVVRSIRMYGDLHRYVLVLVAWKGYKILEVEVGHQPRKYGTTKYGSSRLIRGFLDILTVYFLEKYLSRPMHLFGTIGALSTALGTGIGLYLSLIRLLLGTSISDRPLLLLAILLIIFGVQSFSIGLIGEMLTKYQYETNLKRPYDVEKQVNLNLPEEPHRREH